MSEWNPRPRAAAAVLRNGGKNVLMVKHIKLDGSAVWQFPGGGVSAGETLEEAVIRELREETGLVGTNPKRLFALPYSKGISTTFLVEVDENARAVLGHDPEDEHAAHKKLAGLAWMKIADLDDNPEIKALLRYLNVSAQPPI